MSARPGRITDLIEVDLPRPRDVETREQRRYFELVTAVREALRRGGSEAATDETLLPGEIASMDRAMAEGGIG
jgi:NitT/TauT family transport system ATP-binding protein